MLNTVLTRLGLPASSKLRIAIPAFSARVPSPGRKVTGRRLDKAVLERDLELHLEALRRCDPLH